VLQRNRRGGRSAGEARCTCGWFWSGLRRSASTPGSGWSDRQDTTEKTGHSKSEDIAADQVRYTKSQAYTKII